MREALWKGWVLTAFCRKFLASSENRDSCARQITELMPTSTNYNDQNLLLCFVLKSSEWCLQIGLALITCAVKTDVDRRLPVSMHPIW